MKKRNHREILISILTLIILAISVEYIVLAKNTEFGDIQKGSIWSVSITNVELNEQKSAISNKTHFDSFSVSSLDTIKEKDGYIDYKVTVKNKGSLVAKLDSIITYSDDPYLKIEYSGIKEYDILYPNQDINFDLKITYTRDIIESKIVDFKIMLIYVPNN